MSVGILVPSYDGYSDIWPISAELFNRYWPDRPWPMYWMTNGWPVPDIATPICRPGVIRQDWGHYIAGALDSVPYPLVLFWVEEIWPLSTVPTRLFIEGAELLKNNADIGIVQLTRYYHRPDVATIGHFTDYPRGKAGFSAALPALFRKDILRHLLSELPLSNEFEQQSARILDRDFPTLRSLAPCVPMFTICDNPLLAGVWRECAIKHLGEQGITVDFSKRGISPDRCLKYMDGVLA
jgi:hypothetical protein